MMDPLANCELRADLAGYTSSRVSLANHRDFDNFDVGSIVLHRISGDEGHVVSVLSLKAPKDAKKNFDKGTGQLRANKPADAAASFQKAVAAYPQYADAWLSLGKVESQMGARDEAQTDFQKAMELDDKLIGPWLELGYMASDQMKWDDAAHYLDQAVRLDPMGSAKPWYFSAIANYNLGRFDVAERSVRAELKLEPGNPHGEYLLGLVLIARKDLKGGAEVLRNYIASAPKSDELESAKKQLIRVENLLGQ
jgi:tetratricopeptide (TPR) repeat protein